MSYLDREDECSLFRNMLRGEDKRRGLIVHSNGEGGTGKTTLLEMFTIVCEGEKGRLMAEPFHFSATRFITWQAILQQIVSSLGNTHFPKYSRLRKLYGAAFQGVSNASSSATRGATIVRHETHFHGAVEGNVHTGTGDIKSGSSKPKLKKTSGSDMDREDSIESSMSFAQYRSYLTRVFLEELSAVADGRSLVCFVDHTEKLDDGTREWLSEVFWYLSESTGTPMILVTCGRHPLKYEPKWRRIVALLTLQSFDKGTIERILVTVLSMDRQHCAGVAELLIEKCGGKPLELTSAMQTLWPDAGVSVTHE